MALNQILIWCGGVSAAGVFSASFKHLVCGGNRGARVNIKMRRSNQVVGSSAEQQAEHGHTNWEFFLFYNYFTMLHIYTCPVGAGMQCSTDK